MTHPGQQFIFYFDVFIEFFLYILHCLIYTLKFLLFHIFIYVICMVRILFIYV